MHITANSIRFRNNLRAYLDHVAATGDRVLITRHGQDVAALVSVTDFEALEKVENSSEMFLEARHEANMRTYQRLKAEMKGGSDR